MYNHKSNLHFEGKSQQAQKALTKDYIAQSPASGKYFSPFFDSISRAIAESKLPNKITIVANFFIFYFYGFKVSIPKFFL